MNTIESIEAHASKERISSSLWKELETVSQKCINCKLCQKECEFLRRYGKPKEIADSYNPGDKKHQAMPFECSLCRLCAAVCPVKINPADMFLEMRREAVRQGNGDYPEHAGILGYEKRGTSKRYTYYALPVGCDTVFFPGCTLPGTHPDKVIKLYEHMKKTIPSLGIVLDCCTKPSHDLGRDNYFNSMFKEMKDFLTVNGIQNILVACPNCYKVFRKYGGKLSVKTVYEFIAENGLPDTGKAEGVIAIHDPCALRFEESVHSAIRNIATKKNLIIEEMPHARGKTLCCGEGGSVGFLSPDLAGNWGLLRKKETNGNRILTYCAGCANYLNSITPTSHIVDLIFEPEITLAGREKVAKAPITYMNRLKLKKHFQKSVHAPVTRERTFSAGEDTGRKGFLKRSLFLLFIIAAILTVRFTGITNYLEQDALRQWIQGYGILAPVVYMLIYTIAPALFLPGLPITIAGGILFGPFWGVIYTITSATLGACVAFLVSRYIARDWIEHKLRGPKWRRLDEGVENHGWKIVAFTRLIPLFPFNLLNYAFGLTKIKFLHYAITTFICMLPACIAFIVFSSSFLDLLKGKISPTLIIGFGLIILVSLIPLFYRKYKAKKGLTDPI
ncbi:MAG: VTT domain-containing protein [Thermodesulfovibrionales bacterium]